MNKSILIFGHETEVSAGTIIDYLDAHQISYRYYLMSENIALPDQSEFHCFIILGGTLNVCDENKYSWLKEEKEFIKKSIQSGKKGLGICLGGQLLAEALGARVTKNKYDEIGWFPLQLLNHSETSPLKEINNSDKLMQSHSYTFDIPADSIHLASTTVTKNQAFLYDNRILGVQFHPEVSAESIKKFYETGEDEKRGPYIQHSTEILEHDDYFVRSRKIMFSILDWLFI
jgi:GMP synthase-like glutamine amidotransferase